MRHRDVHVQLIVAGLARLPPQQGAYRRQHVQGLRFERVRVVVEGLVLEVLPDGQIAHNVDSERHQISRRADARSQQDRRTPVGAARKDHLARRNLRATRRGDADRMSPGEQNAIDEHIARDLKVGAVADLLGEIDQAVF